MTDDIVFWCCVSTVKIINSARTHLEQNKKEKEEDEEKKQQSTLWCVFKALLTNWLNERVSEQAIGRSKTDFAVVAYSIAAYSIEK